MNFNIELGILIATIIFLVIYIIISIGDKERYQNDNIDTIVDNSLRLSNYFDNNATDTTENRIYGIGTAPVVNSPKIPIIEFKFIFTNMGAKGNNGPKEITYNPLPNDNLTLSNGIQYWTVPANGRYTIIAAGAAGGSAKVNTTTVIGGRGVIISNTFNFTKGSIIKILVGQKGIDVSGNMIYGGGGGGTYIVDSNNSPLLVAGGGAGATNGRGVTNGGDASLSTTGGGSAATPGGIDGYGGGCFNGFSGSGAGFLAATSGGPVAYSTWGGNGSRGAKSFLNGGTGYLYGGFGGGDGAGGGYSGGGSDGDMWQFGGGGSYDSQNAGRAYYTTQYKLSITANGGTYTDGYCSGDGFVSIELLPTFKEFTFTTMGATGANGPTSITYNPLPIGNLKLSNGIQYWTVTTTAKYRIIAAGAAGSTAANSGRGVIISTIVTLNSGDVIKILVGQMNGGGTFIAYNSNNLPILVAGGGGGPGGNSGIDGSLTISGTSANGSSLPAGGTSGGGGGGSQNGTGTGGGGGTGQSHPNGSGGGGYYGDGGIAYYNGNFSGGGSFVNKNGLGGSGFGGGGNGSPAGGAGGGGYSGGGGGNSWNMSSLGGGGGGGSYDINGTNNNATLYTNVDGYPTGYNKSNGFVIITIQ